MSPGVNPLDPEERLSPIEWGGYEGGKDTADKGSDASALARSGQSVPVR
jgi:hypothetical protein